jgi:predicted CXXCH cytochrome family protein
MLIGLALGVVALTATTSFASIKGSKHDLSYTNQGGAGYSAPEFVNGLGDTVQEDRICIFCHTPHNAIKAGAVAANGNDTDSTTLSYSPLWNRSFTQNVTYQMYNNGTGGAGNPMIIDNDTSTGTGSDSAGWGDGSVNRHMMNGTPAMSGISLLCMSCHDGVTAVNAFSSNNGMTTPGGDAMKSGIESEWIKSGTINSTGNGTTVMASAYSIGRTGAEGSRVSTGDLSNHHPIGMSWSDSEKDPEINPRTTAFGPNLTIQDVLQGGDIMTCASCHDVHNADDNYKFLHRDNFTQSAFCLTCHKK